MGHRSPRSKPFKMSATFVARYPTEAHKPAPIARGAEKYFKRASKVEPKDAEALSKYSNFLSVVRKDLWAAEETLLEAIALDPENSFYAATYANFLWSNGADDTCFPIDSPEIADPDGL